MNFTDEELFTIFQELNANSEAYLKAMKRVGPQAAEKLNIKVSKIADVLEKINIKFNYKVEV